MCVFYSRGVSMANLRNFIVFGKFFCDNFLISSGLTGPHPKGAKVVGAQGDLGMERRLPAAARRHRVTSMTGIGKLRQGPWVGASLPPGQGSFDYWFYNSSI